MDFLKRTGLDISPHKLKEVIVIIKGDNVELDEIVLDGVEFVKSLTVI